MSTQKHFAEYLKGVEYYGFFYTSNKLVTSPSVDRIYLTSKDGKTELVVVGTTASDNPRRIYDLTGRKEDLMSIPMGDLTYNYRFIKGVWSQVDVERTLKGMRSKPMERPMLFLLESDDVYLNDDKSVLINHIIPINNSRYVSSPNFTPLHPEIKVVVVDILGFVDKPFPPDTDVVLLTVGENKTIQDLDKIYEVCTSLRARFGEVVRILTRRLKPTVSIVTLTRPGYFDFDYNFDTIISNGWLVKDRKLPFTYETPKQRLSRNPPYNFKKES